MTCDISVIIPSYNTSKEHLQTLYCSLLNQTYTRFEVIIVDDKSEFNHYGLIKDKRFKVIYKNNNSGPAHSRNIGADKAKGKYLFFTDSDCELEVDILEIILKNLKRESIIMGNTITRHKSFFGKAVAYLGFPGGGILGFDKVFKVDDSGYTFSMSSCNVSMKAQVFFETGKFDTSFPVPAGEDTFFARTAVNKGYKIKYDPFQIVYHVEKSTLKSFIKWQVVRGRGHYYMKGKMGSINNLLKMRLWSLKNSLVSAGPIFGPVVLFLFTVSAFSQIKGAQIEKALKNKV